MDPLGHRGLAVGLEALNLGAEFLPKGAQLASLSRDSSSRGDAIAAIMVSDSESHPL
jgi:hypothetical protein